MELIISLISGAVGGNVAGNVAEIIDLQVERQRVARAQNVRLDGTTGQQADGQDDVPPDEKFAKDDQNAIPSPSDDLH